MQIGLLVLPLARSVPSMLWPPGGLSPQPALAQAAAHSPHLWLQGLVRENPRAVSPHPWAPQSQGCGAGAAGPRGEGSLKSSL